MQKQTYLLRNAQILRNLKAALDTLPLNEEFPLEVKISDPKRTLPQNDMFHALCGNVAEQGVVWAGSTWEPQDWKCIFVSGHAKATGRDGKLIPGLEGEAVALARESTANMGKKRMTSLIEYSQAWAIGEGVKPRTTRYSFNYYGHQE
ncbi:recombination protein NinB [Morganella morganii]|uniref:recombination protein NinB n=1 Tax=Morganella morganii TaxID=582 RepID=UPI001BDB7071|nr:recombination protein NinB [Morganella morganii]MBT0442287.1 recombination protein NinB [Morganella morganii subsp. morganii]